MIIPLFFIFNKNRFPVSINAATADATGMVSTIPNVSAADFHATSLKSEVVHAVRAFKPLAKSVLSSKYFQTVVASMTLTADGA